MDTAGKVCRYLVGDTDVEGVMSGIKSTHGLNSLTHHITGVPPALDRVGSRRSAYVLESAWFGLKEGIISISQ